MRTRKRKLVTMLATVGLVLLVVAIPAMAETYTFPNSTNDLNKASNAPLRPGQAAPYVEQVGVGAGSVTLRFHGAPAGITYFEVRTDGFVVTSGTPHEYLLLVDPVLYANEYEYPGVLVLQNGVVTQTFNADSKIEVRLALGGENDWFFDWVTFGVPDASVPYGDITVSGGYQTGHFPEAWSLSACDLTLSATVDLNGMVDDLGGAAAHAWSELGVRDTSTSSDFNPNTKGVWLATDYDWTANTFDPDTTPNLDLDDKLILQRQSGQGEGAYDLPSVPPAPGNNHRIWWDRDGVDPYQNPETANTGGLYDVVISLHANDATNGTAYMTINGLAQGFETDGDWSTIELTPAGMNFTGDMTSMQVFYGLYGYGATHSATFNDITVTGCPAYTFNGFLQPVDNSALNLAKAGQAIPVKWSLFDYLSNPISDPSSVVEVKATDTSCSSLSGEAVDAIEAYAFSEPGALTYLDNGNWEFNWKTPKSYAGTCKTLTLTLDDGTTHTADFQFK